MVPKRLDELPFVLGYGRVSERNLGMQECQSGVKGKRTQVKLLNYLQSHVRKRKEYLNVLSLNDLHWCLMSLIGFGEFYAAQPTYNQQLYFKTFPSKARMMPSSDGGVGEGGSLDTSLKILRKNM